MTPEQRQQLAVAAGIAAAQEDPSGDDDPWELLALLLWLRMRNKQEDIADTVVRSVTRSWSILDFNNLDDTKMPWVEAVLPSVRYGFDRSQQAMANFMDDYRTLWQLATGESVEDRPRIITATRDARPDSRLGADWNNYVTAPAFDPVEAAQKMLLSGPYKVKSLMPAPEVEAMGKGAVSAAGSAVKTAMDGGRQLVDSEVAADMVAKGYQRVTDGDPCSFCALLASRGPVYDDGSFPGSDKFLAPAEFEDATGSNSVARVHDHCRCGLVPVYSSFSPVDPWGKVALRVWTTLGATGNGFSNTDKFKLYRRAYDSVKSAGVDPAVSSDKIVELTRSFVDSLEPASGRFVRSLLAAA